MNIREIAEYTLEKLSKLGADAAAVSVTHGSNDEINVDGGEFSLMRTVFNSDISLRVLKGGAKGTASINQTDKESIDAACAAALDAAMNSQPDEAERIAPFGGVEKFEQGILLPDIDALYERTLEFLRDTKSEFPKILLEQFITNYERESSIYMNSNGTIFERDGGAYFLSSTFSAHEGEAAGSFNSAGASLADLNTPFIDLAGHRRLFRESSDSLYPTSVDGKFVGTVIATPSLMADFMYTILANFCGASSIIEKTSPWLDKLGQQVASSALSLSTRPLDERIVWKEHYAEGFKSENMDYIKNGVLQGFMLSDYASRKTGFERAKNLSTYMFVEPGDSPLSEIIANTERGLLVNRFSGDQPGANGDFSGVAKNSFLIENGKIVGAVAETMINGNFAEMLKNVRAISRETECDGRSVLPWVAFEGVTISGK